MKRLTLSSILTVTAALLFLSGCFVLPVEDSPPPPPIAYIHQAPALRTVVVMRGDVIRYTNPIASYVAAREERLAFDISGLRVRGIYKDVGDYVQQGDVIASLYWPEIEAQYESALRKEEWLRLELSHLERRHRQAPDADAAHFAAERTRLIRELAILETELDYLKRESQRQYLRAGMDGTVSHIARFTEGMISAGGGHIATIVDQTHSVFALRSEIAQPFMSVGDYFTLYLNRVPYMAVVIDPDEFGIDRGRGTETYLTFVDEAPIMPARPVATVHVVMETAENVLHIPLQAVNRASDRVFVYVLTADGVRVRRDIELGVRGNTTYEVVNGLEEGELVIIG